MHTYSSIDVDSDMAKRWTPHFSDSSCALLNFVYPALYDLVQLIYYMICVTILFIQWTEKIYTF